MIGRKLEQELLQEAVEKVQERIRRTMEYAGNSKPVISVLVTTYGVERNEYSGRFQKVVTLEELFCWK